MRTLTHEQQHQLDAVINQIPDEAMRFAYVSIVSLDHISLDGVFTLEALQSIVQCLASFAVPPSTTRQKEDA